MITPKKMAKMKLIRRIDMVIESFSLASLAKILASF